MLQGAGIIFFSYVGFDTASTTALEARNPQRDLPIGIIGTLVISTVLYVAMAAVITGMVPYFKLNDAEPVAVALDAHPALAWLGVFLKIGHHRRHDFGDPDFAPRAAAHPALHGR